MDLGARCPSATRSLQNCMNVSAASVNGMGCCLSKNFPSALWVFSLLSQSSANRLLLDTALTTFFFRPRLSSVHTRTYHFSEYSVFPPHFWQAGGVLISFIACLTLPQDLH